MYISGGLNELRRAAPSGCGARGPAASGGDVVAVVVQVGFSDSDLIRGVRLERLPYRPSRRSSGMPDRWWREIKPICSSVFSPRAVRICRSSCAAATAAPALLVITNSHDVADAGHQSATDHSTSPRDPSWSKTAWCSLAPDLCGGLGGEPTWAVAGESRS
jgi:hypothetical protein